MRLRYTYTSNTPANGSRALFTSACTTREPSPTRMAVRMRPTSTGTKPVSGFTVSGFRFGAPPAHVPARDGDCVDCHAQHR